NPDTPLWTADGAWTLTDELRIGTVDGDGPELFGRIRSLAVDGGGRIYVLEAQAQEIRVFDGDGAHLRTIGREGGGPGEFARALHMEIGPDGDLWVVDPQNNRLSVFDTAGTYLEGHAMPGGFTLIPWPGGFDRHGRYHYPVPRRSEGEFRVGLARYDADLRVVDTLALPTDPVEREYFELRSDQGFARASVPFAGSFQRRLSPDGTLWGMLTDEYRMFELSPTGDTLRTITRAYEPLPVTGEDVAAAREDLEWFTEQGGRVDLGRIPSHKPAVEDFVFDDQGNVWVWPVVEPALDGRELDVFDPVGRYLGRVTAPVPIARRPFPVIRDRMMVAVTRSELDVPYVVRLRIDKGREPSAAEDGRI
ncbi:MAG: 6-bladed beta-propeller, partial [Gemmatimonadetes bacterium]|nr:6-bladed beta-propeller [Gemmatimonadota bacterium]NIR40525.1 6-bladed beta-propeller [Actinomycetota bacterium]NIU78664.1 6-bladed beta-propeller [Gammaproteobacteria bacterium]NIQ58452.1 6-bladed beta-propeller [Gemmatimonadota bacterium]NIX47495.1 6-bladed beta-propeller [Gemmatimonadota bacterium]